MLATDITFLKSYVLFNSRQFAVSEVYVCVLDVHLVRFEFGILLLESLSVSKGVRVRLILLTPNADDYFPTMSDNCILCFSQE